MSISGRSPITSRGRAELSSREAIPRAGAYFALVVHPQNKKQKFAGNSLASDVVVRCADLLVPQGSLQLRVLGLGLPQDGDVGVGVLPESEEILIGGERPNAGNIGQ